MPRLPVSLHSLLIQCAALFLAACAFWLFARFGQTAPGVWPFVLAQGTLAATLSVLMRQPVWWPPLHFAFLPVALLALRSGLPPGIYLAVFVLLALFFWSTFRTRVPLYLSDRKAWDALAALLPADRAFRFIDLGSGLGDVPLQLEKRFPLGCFEGTEIAPALWLISRLRAAIRHSRVIFRRRDYAALDLGAYDIVFAFLSPAAMPALWAQAQTQMREGSVFISLSFGIAGQTPDETISLSGGARHMLHVWRMRQAK
ncbi:MAG: hypothetical protein BGO61_03715 [Thiobacillus sp. 65-69]|nr:class I SAM-dependent methyltransferase [Thiobacillus sp.]ODU89528.1 MAG: hypothetical protein ABT21_07385 [Thiobacillus sp. SCN 65-179]OJW37456.1 MAG: hypothetical protein BGO61_03715 [Thiobacillus sp. 65-69]